MKFFTKRKLILLLKLLILINLFIIPYFFMEEKAVLDESINEVIHKFNVNGFQANYVKSKHWKDKSITLELTSSELVEKTTIEKFFGENIRKVRNLKENSYHFQMYKKLYDIDIFVENLSNEKSSFIKAKFISSGFAIKTLGVNIFIGVIFSFIISIYIMFKLDDWTKKWFSSKR